MLTFSGISLDPGLRLNKHIDSVIQGAQGRINTLKTIVPINYGRLCSSHSTNSSHVF